MGAFSFLMSLHKCGSKTQTVDITKAFLKKKNLFNGLLSRLVIV
jgi:hypothetical protein